MELISKRYCLVNEGKEIELESFVSLQECIEGALDHSIDKGLSEAISE